MTRSEKIAHNRAAKRIEAAYQRTCCGVQVNIMKIGSIFTEGHRLISAGADDAALETGIRAYVETIREN